MAEGVSFHFSKLSRLESITLSRNYDSSPVLSIYLDLAHLPVTFDCLAFLWGADLYRQRHGIPSQEVIVVSDSYRGLSPRDKVYDNDVKKWRRLNFLDRLAWLFPATVSVTSSERFPHAVKTLSYPENYSSGSNNVDWAALYSTRHFKESRLDADPFPLRAPSCAVEMLKVRYGAGRVVTLSVRDSSFQPERNWPLEEVKEVCRYLKARNLEPVVIPDFETLTNTDSELYRWDKEEYGDVLWQASSDIFLRAAAYENSAHNLVVGNGTSYLVWFSRSPYSLFNIVVPGYPTTSAQFQFTFHGVREGKKPHWSTLGNQHWVWEECSSSNVIKHLEQIQI